MQDASVHVFDFDDRHMVYTRSGVTEGPDFLLVHGIGMGYRVFRDLAVDLGEHGTVYAVDLPGFGDSPEPPSALDMPSSADLLAEFIDSLGLANPVLVGHSMGTQVVAEVLARHPEMSQRAVLIAPTVNRAERTARHQAWRMVQDLTGESPKVLTLGMVQYVKAGPGWFLRKLQQMLRHSIEDTLPQVQAHTLVLRGEKDRVCPREWVEHVAELLPSSRMEEIPGRGHEAMIRSPDPVAHLIIDHAERTEVG